MTTSGYQVVLTDRPLRQVIGDLLIQAGAHGLTVAEARDLLPERHHGHVSGVFSILHKQERFSRLSEQRDGYKIYVLPEHVGGRPTEFQGRLTDMTEEELAHARALDEFLSYWLQVDHEGARFGTDRTKAERNQRVFFERLKTLWNQRQ